VWYGSESHTTCISCLAVPCICCIAIFNCTQVDNRSSEPIECSVSLVRIIRLKSLGMLGDSTLQTKHTVVQKDLRTSAATGAVAGGSRRFTHDEWQVPAFGSATFQEALPLDSADLVASLSGSTQVTAGCCHACLCRWLLSPVDDDDDKETAASFASALLLH